MCASACGLGGARRHWEVTGVQRTLIRVSARRASVWQTLCKHLVALLEACGKQHDAQDGHDSAAAGKIAGQVGSNVAPIVRAGVAPCIQSDCDLGSSHWPCMLQSAVTGRHGIGARYRCPAVSAAVPEEVRRVVMEDSMAVVGSSKCQGTATQRCQRTCRPKSDGWMASTGRSPCPADESTRKGAHGSIHCRGSSKTAPMVGRDTGEPSRASAREQGIGGGPHGGHGWVSSLGTWFVVKLYLLCK